MSDWIERLALAVPLWLAFEILCRPPFFGLVWWFALVLALVIVRRVWRRESWKC